MFGIKLISIPSILILSLLTSCMGPYEEPTPSTSYLSANGGRAIFGDGSILNYGPDAGNLSTRDSDISNSYYDGKEMLTGVLKPTYFGFDSTEVEASQRATLQATANYLINNPKYDILIEGRCDWYGTEDYNMQLGDRRANSVSIYLQDLGVNESRIKTISKGSLESQVGLTKSRASKDRRADLILLK